MLQAVGVKVAPGDERDFSVLDSHRRGRIGATVKHGKLGNGFAWTVEGKHLFAATHGGFENAHLALGDDVQSGTGFTFREEELAFTQMFANRARGEQLQFLL